MDTQEPETVESDILQNWTLTSKEKLLYTTEGHNLKQGLWTKEETEMLKLNILEYCENHQIADPTQIIFNSGKDERKDFYKTVRKGINRPIFSVYRRLVRMYDSKNHLGKYSSKEIQQIKELRREHGNDWQKIGQVLGRSAASIKDRCRHLKEDCNSGPWSSEEEDRLIETVHNLTKSLPGEESVTGIPWIQVAQRVITRSERQCRKKWMSYCTMKKFNEVEWMTEDDIYLVNRLATCEAKDDSKVPWQSLAQSWPRPSVKTYQWLRAKWKSLKSSIVNNQEMNLKEICQQLLNKFTGSVQYLNARKTFDLCNDNTSENMMSVIGIVASTPVEANFMGQQPSVYIAPSCSTNIPLYIGCPILGLPSIQLSSNINFVTSVVRSENPEVSTVVHLMDSDGTEVPAVTTDVMLSGSCN